MVIVKDHPESIYVVLVVPPVKLDCWKGVIFTTVPEGSAEAGIPVALVKLIDAGVPVALVKTKADGVPKLGVVKTGLVSVSGAFKPFWLIVEIAIIYPNKEPEKLLKIRVSFAWKVAPELNPAILIWR